MTTKQSQRFTKTTTSTKTSSSSLPSIAQVSKEWSRLLVEREKNEIYRKNMVLEKNVKGTEQFAKQVSILDAERMKLEQSMGPNALRLFQRTSTIPNTQLSYEQVEAVFLIGREAEKRQGKKTAMDYQKISNENFSLIMQVEKRAEDANVAYAKFIQDEPQTRRLTRSEQAKRKEIEVKLQNDISKSSKELKDAMEEGKKLEQDIRKERTDVTMAVENLRSLLEKTTKDTGFNRLQILEMSSFDDTSIDFIPWFQGQSFFARTWFAKNIEAIIMIRKDRIPYTTIFPRPEPVLWFLSNEPISTIQSETLPLYQQLWKIPQFNMFPDWYALLTEVMFLNTLVVSIRDDEKKKFQMFVIDGNKGEAPNNRVSRASLKNLRVVYRDFATNLLKDKTEVETDHLPIEFLTGQMALDRMRQDTNIFLLPLVTFIHSGTPHIDALTENNMPKRFVRFVPSSKQNVSLPLEQVRNALMITRSQLPTNAKNPLFDIKSPQELLKQLQASVPFAVEGLYRNDVASIYSMWVKAPIENKIYEDFPIILIVQEKPFKENGGEQDIGMQFYLPRAWLSERSSFSCMHLFIDRTPIENVTKLDEERKSKAIRVFADFVKKNAEAGQTSNSGWSGDVHFIAGDGGCLDLISTPGRSGGAGAVNVNMAKLISSIFDLDFVTLDDAAQVSCARETPELAPFSKKIPNLPLRVPYTFSKGMPWYSNFGFTPISSVNAIVFIDKIKAMPWQTFYKAIVDTLSDTQSHLRRDESDEDLDGVLAALESLKSVGDCLLNECRLKLNIDNKSIGSLSRNVSSPTASSDACKNVSLMDVLVKATRQQCFNTHSLFVLLSKRWFMEVLYKRLLQSMYYYIDRFFTPVIQNMVWFRRLPQSLRSPFSYKPYMTTGPPRFGGKKRFYVVLR